MSYTWSLDRFRTLVRSQRKPGVTDRALSAADALARELSFATFHGHEALGLIDRAQVPRGGSNEPHGYAVLSQFFEEFNRDVSDRPLREASFKASAHLVACLRCAHISTDLLAPVIYWSLDLSNSLPKPIAETSLSPAKIHGAIVAAGIHSRVAVSLEQLLTLPAYRYIRAFSNATKHRGFVGAGLSIALDFMDGPRPGLRISRFSYDTDYPEQQAKEFLQAGYRQVAKGIIRVGRSVNAELASPRKRRNQRGPNGALQLSSRP